MVTIVGRGDMWCCAADWQTYSHMLDELQDRIDKDKERPKKAAATAPKSGKRIGGGSAKKPKPAGRRYAHTPQLGWRFTCPGV